MPIIQESLRRKIVGNMIGNDHSKALQTLSEIRAAWAITPKPNAEIPDFDFEFTSKLIASTERFEEMGIDEIYIATNAIISELVVPLCEISEPPPSILLIHYRLSVFEKTLKSILPPPAPNIDFYVDEGDKEITELKSFLEDVKTLIPQLQKEAEAVKIELQNINNTLEKNNEMNSGLNSVQVGALGISVSVSTIREQVGVASRALGQISARGALNNVIGAIRSIIRSAKWIFDRKVEETKAPSRFAFLLTLSKLAESATSALLSAKRLFARSFRNDVAPFSRSVQGAIPIENYLIQFKFSDKDRTWLDAFLRAGRSAKRNDDRFIEFYLNPDRSTASPSETVQSVVFSCIVLKKEIAHVTSVYWGFGKSFNSFQINTVLDGVETLLAICLRENSYKERMEAKKALAVLGFAL
jgi:hypothetical protein